MIALNLPGRPKKLSRPSPPKMTTYQIPLTPPARLVALADLRQYAEFVTIQNIIKAFEAETICLNIMQALTVANLSGGEVARQIMRALK